MDDMKDQLEQNMNNRWWKPWCTSQRVRESIVVSLLGMRTTMQTIDTTTHERLIYMWTRCDEIRKQIRTLISMGDRKRARRFRKKIRSYQRRIAEKLGGAFPNMIIEDPHDAEEAHDLPHKQ